MLDILPPLACLLLVFFGMASLRIMMLLVALAVCYLLFVRTQTVPGTRKDGTADGLPPGTTAQSQYRQAMDKAHAAARQMQEQRAEADAP